MFFEFFGCFGLVRMVLVLRSGCWRRSGNTRVICSLHRLGSRKMGSFKMEFSVFDGKGDFNSWSKRIRALLSHNKVLVALEADENKWSEEALKRKPEILEEAYNLLILNLSDAVLRKVDGLESAIEVWDKLKSIYSDQSAPNLAFLKGAIFNYKMDATKSIDENLDEFLKMNQLLKGSKQALDDTSLAVILLNSLPDSYTVVKDSLQYTGTVPSLELVISGLKTREIDLKNQKRSSGSNLFVKEKSDCSSSNNPAKNKKKNKSANNNSSNKSEGRKCFYCKKVGHVKKDCYKWLAKQKNTTPETNVAVNHAVESVGCDVLNVSDQIRSREWIIDSGCTFHMCPYKEWFVGLKPVDSGLVYMGNNHPCKIEGIGSIIFKLENDTKVVLTDVRLIPCLKRNLISIGWLDDLGCSTSLENGVATIRKDGKPILTGVKQNGLYVLSGAHCSCVTSAALVSTNHAGPDKWHLRLGHMSQKGLDILGKQGKFGKDQFHNISFCETCIMGKQHRQKFSKGNHCSTQILEYMHADLWGPDKTITHGGFRYFMSIVDDHSRMVWTCLLKSKDEAFEQFKKWQVLVENQTDKHVKTLRTDNGLEFCNYFFDKYYSEKGITRHHTVRLTPQ